jgi:uncharacterized protein with FMN-binding domain
MNTFLKNTALGLLGLVLVYAGATYLNSTEQVPHSYSAATPDLPKPLHPTQNTTLPTPSPTTEPVTTNRFKDGTYSADGEYGTPAGSDIIGVSLTLKNDIVVDSAVVVKAENPASKKFQQQFASGYKTLVVGKKIADIHLDVVSGASLSPDGFNAAVVAIRSQASH